MNRLVKPREFVLNAYAPTAEDLGKPLSAVMQEILDAVRKFGGEVEDPDGFLNLQPVLLRWATHPHLGFGRKPFKVFQRINRNTDFRPLKSGTTVVSGFESISWQVPGLAMQMYEVRLMATTADSFMQIRAVGSDDEPIEGQVIFLKPNTTRRCCFRATGIKSIMVFGEGEIRELRGIDQLTYANFEDWFEMDIVGFPFSTSEISGPAYEPGIQGYVFSPLEGPDAAMLRLEIARILHLPIPDIPFPPSPVDWQPPDPGAYADWLRTEPMETIRKCLENTDDRDENNLQVDFLSSRTIPGIRQVDSPSTTPGPDVKTELPVVGTTMLGAISDGFLATGLGYGTLAFGFDLSDDPDQRCTTPKGGFNMMFDFMVTNEFVLNPSPDAPSVEIAALAQLRPEPKLALNFEATKRSDNRPPDRDLPAGESVKLSWDFPEFIQSYALAVQRTSQLLQVLNSRRITGDSFNPFLPAVSFKPDRTVIEPGVATFTDPTSFVPVSGSVHADYNVIGLDVFGRWSLWRRAPYDVAAPPVQKPAIHRFEIILDDENGPVFSARMEIDFSWEWIDRSPHTVEFLGHFFPADSSSAPSTIPGGFFVTTNQSIPGFYPKVRILFDPATEEPALQIPHTGTIIPLIPESPAGGGLESDLRTYRLTLEGITCDFSGAEDLAYVLFARAAEKVRPTAFSELVGPAVARIADPTPPDTPQIVAEVIWTALPDATGTARGLLTWPAVAGAKGYNVWEATEQAIRVAVDPDITDPAAGQTIVDRATALKTLMLGADAASMQAFSKLNKELVRDNRLEVALPGKSDTVFAFRISAVNGQNKDSQRSAPVFFAVPHRNEPGHPKLILRKAGEPSPGIWVIALPGAGPDPAGYRIHRVTNVFLQKDIGTMGPPLVLDSDTGWRPLNDLLSDPSVSKLHSLIRSLEPFERELGKAFFDTPATRWDPYFYRIVAIGEENLPEGKIAGESPASASKKMLLTPPGPPALRNLEILEGQLEPVNSVTMPGPREVSARCMAGKIFVTSFNNRLIVIDAEQETTADELNLPGNPVALALNNETERVYVACQNPNQISVIDARSNALISSLSLPRRPEDLKCDASLNKIYITGDNSQVIVLDGDTNQIIKQINTGGINSAIDIDREKKLVYVADRGNNRLHVIRSTTDSLVQSIPLPFSAGRLRVDPVLSRIYVSDRAGDRLAVIHQQTLAFEKILNLGGRVFDLESDSGINKMYATLSNQRLAVIDTKRQETERFLDFSDQLRGVGLCPELGKIFLAQPNQNHLLILKPESSNLVLRFETDLPVKPTETGKAVIQLQALSFDPSTGRAIREAPFLKVNVHEVDEGPPLTLITSPTQEELDAMPEINRTAPGPDGFSSYSVRVATAELEEKRIIIKVTNPLNQTTEEQFNGIP